LRAFGITGATASLQVNQLAGDAGKVDVAGVFVFEFMQTAFAAVIA
jgi:hypothetical protein